MIVCAIMGWSAPPMLGLTELSKGLMKLGTKENVQNLGYWSNSVQKHLWSPLRGLVEKCVAKKIHLKWLFTQLKMVSSNTQPSCLLSVLTGNLPWHSPALECTVLQLWSFSVGNKTKDLLPGQWVTETLSPPFGWHRSLLTCCLYTVKLRSPDYAWWRLSLHKMLLTFPGNLCSSASWAFQQPPFRIPWQKAPQPLFEASVSITTSVFTSWTTLLFQVARFETVWHSNIV